MSTFLQKISDLKITDSNLQFAEYYSRRYELIHLNKTILLTYFYPFICFISKLLIWNFWK
jgi:chorismate-pyruvate lyase